MKCPKCRKDLKAGYCSGCNYDSIIKQKSSSGSGLDSVVRNIKITQYEGRKLLPKDLTRRDVRESISFVQDLEPESSQANWKEFNDG